MFALPGQCDLYGYLRGGQTIEVELKAAGKRIAPGSDQDNWRRWCGEWGVMHVVLTAKKNETVKETVDRWCSELESCISGLVI
jgi:hypothetical protein